MGDERRHSIPRKATVVAPTIAFVALFVVYLVLMPSGLRGADSAEFATLSATQGVAHPPGYPLYTWMLRMFAWLPLEPHHAASLLTMVLGASAGAIVAAIAGTLGARRAVAVVVALLVGTQQHVLALHTHPEVFALNNLLAAAIVWVCVHVATRERPRAGGWVTVASLGLLAGLGLANHHSIVLLAPIGLFGVWRAVRQTRSFVLGLAVAVLGLLVGLAPYLVMYLTWQPCDGCLSWGDGGSAAAFWHHVTRADYGTTSLGIGGAAQPVAHLAAFLRATVLEQFGVLAALAVVGAVRGWRTHRVVVATAGLAAVLSGPLFVMLFNIELSSIGEAIVARFYALPVIAAAPLVVFALRGLSPRATVAAAGVAVLIASFNVYNIAQRDHTMIDDYVRDTLTPLPPDAVVLSTGDHRYFGAMYTQLVRGHRVDVVWVDAKLLAYGWYGERISRQLGVTLPRSTATEIPIQEVIREIQRAGRTVYLTHMFTPHLASWPSYPFGTTIRLLSTGERPPPPGELAAENVELFEAMRRRPEDALLDPWARDLGGEYARTWRSLADALRAVGDERGADHAEQLATMYEVQSDAR